MAFVGEGMVGLLQRRNKHADDEVKVEDDDDHTAGLGAYQDRN